VSLIKAIIIIVNTSVIEQVIQFTAKVILLAKMIKLWTFCDMDPGTGVLVRGELRRYYPHKMSKMYMQILLSIVHF